MAGDMKVLNALDSAKTQWYHFTAIIIAGMGFFTDAYDLFCISLVTKLLGRIYYHVDGSSKPGSLPPNISAAVNGVAFCGTLAGQLFFGWLGDKMGRKKVYGMTLMLMCICSIASGLSFGREPKTVLTTLCFFRFWLGFGIGGDYLLSATIMSEYANKKTRGAFIAAVFAMQGFGILGGGIFAIIVSAAFQASFKAPAYEVDAVGSTVPQADYVWRIILMVGAIPALLTYYWRMKMPETARYTALVAKNVQQATADMEKVMQVEIGTEKKEPTSAVKSNNEFGLFTKQFLSRHGLHLLGTCSTWFLLDIAYYSQNLFQKDIFSAIGWIPAAKTMNAIEEDWQVYHSTAWFLNDDSVHVYSGNSLRPLDSPWQPYRGRISAASGKLGAMVGAFGFLYLAQPQDKTKADAGYPAGIGVRNSLLVLAVVNLLGTLCTFLVPESKGKSLEEISRENDSDETDNVMSVSGARYGFGKKGILRSIGYGIVTINGIALIVEKIVIPGEPNLS
ncbi:putative inorganic phosphate transporter 1-3 [Capsicum chinense]|nr:putative inorganic phosphate transporter 1-3 [Capsicum chinense]